MASFDPSSATAGAAAARQVFKQARGRIAEADSRRVVPQAELAGLGSAARRRLLQERAAEADQAVQEALQDVLAEFERQLAVALAPDERVLLAEGRFDRRLEDGLVALVKQMKFGNCLV